MSASASVARAHKPVETPVENGRLRAERSAFPRIAGGAFVEDADLMHPKLRRDGGQLLPVAVGGDADEFQVIRMSGDHAQGAPTDGAGGAEQDQSFATRRRDGGGSHGSARR
jgi:hypothetical protein